MLFSVRLLLLSRMQVVGLMPAPENDELIAAGRDAQRYDRGRVSRSQEGFWPEADEAALPKGAAVRICSGSRQLGDVTGKAHLRGSERIAHDGCMGSA